MVDIWAPVAQNLMDLIFIKISGLVDGCKGLFTTLSFFDFSRDVAMATDQSRKIEFMLPFYVGY